MLGVTSFATMLMLTAAIPTAQSPQTTAVASMHFGRAETDALISKTISDAMAAEHVPGVAVVLVKDGKVEMTRGFGLADVDRGTPVSPTDTIFRIGSITKAFTAQGLMQYVDCGRISLDDDVNRYLTRFKLDERFSEPVRVRNLMTHTAGFDQVGDHDREFSRPEDRPALGDYLARTLHRIRPAGQVSSYDTWGITLGGYLLEQLSGTTYANYMKRNIFAPLGMTRTNVETPAALASDLAVGYRYTNGAYARQAYEYYTTTPASSIDATAGDMGNFMIALLGDGSADGHNAFMSKRTLAQYQQIQFANSPSFPAYSYGFKEEAINGQRVLRHGGVMNGFASDMVLLPAHNTGLFIVYNADRTVGGAPVQLRDTLLRAVMNEWFSATRPAQRPTINIDTTRFAGKYADNMYCHTCFESDPEGWPISSVAVITSLPGGAIEMSGGRWNAVGPLTFQSTTTGNLMEFREDESGRITHLINRNGVGERLDTRLLDEALGAGWRNRPASPLAAVVYSQNEAWSECGAAYGAISASRVSDGNAAFNAGVCWAHAGDGRRAVSELEKAWSLKERPSRTAFWLGASFGVQKDLDHAFEWLNRALDLGFDKRRLTTETILEGLRGDARFALLLARQAGI